MEINWNVARIGELFQPQLLITDHDNADLPATVTIRFNPLYSYREAREAAKRYKRNAIGGR